MKIVKIELKGASGPGCHMSYVAEKVTLEYVDKPEGVLINSRFLIPLHMITQMIVEEEESIIKQKVRKMSEDK